MVTKAINLISTTTSFRFRSMTLRTEAIDDLLIARLFTFSSDDSNTTRETINSTIPPLNHQTEKELEK